jgi:transcriptional regulator with GAF, ATPase, and Fis domain
MDVSVDLLLIPSINRDLKEMVANGQFHEDFHYCASVIPSHVPPLRERPGDIEPLARHFLRELSLQSRGSGPIPVCASAGLARRWPADERRFVPQRYAPGSVVGTILSRREY